MYAIKTYDIRDQVTVWERPGATMFTEYGMVTYREWCKLECRRLGIRNKYKYFIKEKTLTDRKNIAIFRKEKKKCKKQKS